MSGIYDVTLAPGATGYLPVSGDYLKVRSAQYGLVQVKLDGGEAFDLDEGLGLRFKNPFRDVNVRNNAAIAQTIRIFIGDSRFEDSRITGTVSVVDSEKTKVIANTVFTAGLSIAGAAGVPYVQLMNPAGSGKLVIVYRIDLGAAMADVWTATIVTNALPTLVANFSSHMSGGADSVAQRRSDNTGAALTGAKALFGGYIPASTSLLIPLPRPILLSAGYGLVIGCGITAGQTNRTSFSFEEVPA